MRTHFSFNSLFAGCVLLSLAAAAGAVQAGQPEDPQVVAQKVYADIKANLNVDLSNTLVDQYFDTHSMAIQALGAPYRSFTADQKTTYEKAFDTYFKKSLFHVLTTYKNVTISGLTSRVDGNRAVVRCVVKPADGEPIDLALNLSLAPSGWKTIDVSVDNILLIHSYTPQFSSLYKQRQFDGLIAFLNSH